jgi:phage-related tail fiber protein
MATLASLTVDDTGFLRLPSGTTAQRIAGQVGMARFNTSTNQQEWFDGVGWVNLIPPGAVRFFARTTAPDGWLKCNGAAVSRTTYAVLFSAIGTTWGAGDGSTTFNVPELRGEFPRVWDDGRGVDSGRGLATFQDQDWKSFYQSNLPQGTNAYTHSPVYMEKSIFGTFSPGGNGIFSGHWAAPSSAQGVAWDTSPIRPRNRALLACIKY